MPHTDITFLHGGFVPSCQARVDKFFEGYWTLQYMSAGRVEVFYDQKRFDMSRNWLWFCYPGPHIRFHPRPPARCWTHRYIAFKGPRALKWSAEGLIGLYPQPAPHAGSGYRARFDKLLELSRLRDRWSILRAANLLEGMLLELAQDRSTGNLQSENWMSEAIERMAGGDVNIHELAEQLGVSVFTFRRTFRKRTGMAPHQYAINARIARAQNELISSDIPIKTIAHNLGYRDVYFFSRQFKKIAGLSPGHFRASSRLVESR